MAARGSPPTCSPSASSPTSSCPGRLPTWPFEWPPAGHRRFLSRVPPPLRPVLRKAAAFDPRHRYPDAVAFHQALERAFAKVEQPRTRSRRRRREKPVLSPLALQAESFRRRSGAALELRFRCHRCDGPIAEAMRACPWCGFTHNSFRELTRYPLVCSSCERGVRPEWTECPWCHAGHFTGNGRKPRPDPSAERQCAARGCPGQLRRFMRYCPRMQAQARPSVVAPGSSGPLHELPRPRLARLLPVLPLVREARAGRAAASGGR